MSDAIAGSPLSEPHWYAVTVRSRQEKVSAAMLEALQVTHFFPTVPELRQWSDRKQLVNFPLFPGYLFVRLQAVRESTLPVLKVPGVVGFVGNQGGPLPIPDREIDDIRRVLAGEAECSPHPFLEEGDRVRVTQGPLAGLEGTLIRGGSRVHLVISIEMIQRSVAVRVDRENVEPIAHDASRTHTGAETSTGDAMRA